MKQVTIHYKNNPKDYKELFNYTMSRAPKWKFLLLAFIYILNLLMVLVAVGGILIGVLYAKLPFVTVLEDLGTTLLIVIVATFFTHTWFFVGYQLFCKKIWETLRTKSTFKIKSITFGERNMSIIKIVGDKEETENINYSSFSKIRQNRNSIFFFMKEKIYTFCPKKYFTEEEWDTVKKWLN